MRKYTYSGAGKKCPAVLTVMQHGSNIYESDYGKCKNYKDLFNKNERELNRTYPSSNFFTLQDEGQSFFAFLVAGLALSAHVETENIGKISLHDNDVLCSNRKLDVFSSRPMRLLQEENRTANLNHRL